MTASVVSDLIGAADGLKIGRGALSELIFAATEFAAEGSKVYLIADGRQAGEVRGLLSRRFRVEQIGKLNATRAFAFGIIPPEDAKLIVSAGGAAASDVGKYVAERFRLPLIHVVTDPSDITYLTPSARLNYGGTTVTYKTAPPKTVIADTSFMSGGETDVAAAFGAVCSRVPALFDAEINALINGEKQNKAIEYNILATVKSLLYADSDGELDAETVAVHAAAAAVAVSSAGDSRFLSGGADQVLQAYNRLSERAGRPLKKEGETLMPVALGVMRTYLSMTVTPLETWVRVPDNNMRLDVMSARLGISPLTVVHRMTECTGAAEQARRSYILRECKTELAAKCRAYEKLMSYAYKRFKRLYKDKGFSYNEYLSAQDLKIAVGIAPEMCEKFTYLTLIKQTGLLDGLLSA